MGLGALKNKRKREILYSRQNGLCFYCQNPLISATEGILEHLKPRSKGGVDGLRNRRLACKNCDSLKSSFENLEEALAHCQRLTEFFLDLRQRNIC